MGLNIYENVLLSSFCTMRIGGPARYLTTVTTKDELVEAVQWATSRSVRFIVIGSGSNTIFTDDGFNGLVCINRITGISKVDEDTESVTFDVGSGEVWDEFVEYSVQQDLSGIEALSLIPGTVGASPVQNIGAYGQEVSSTILEAEAYDSHMGKFIKLKNKDLAFKYRTSKLKVPVEKRHIYICSVTFKLSKKKSLINPLYDSLEKHCVRNNIKDLSPSNIRNAVIAIRSAKLPDPKYVANSGSFFINPIVSKNKFLKLKSEHPDVKAWHVDNNRYKISAAWLIDSSGLGEFRLGGFSFFKNQHLVVVNKSAKNAVSLITFKDNVVKTVQDKFGIVLDQEPELI